MPLDKKQNFRTQNDEEEGVLTTKNFNSILEVNRKAIEINIEVEKQNEQVIGIISDISEQLNTIFNCQNDIKAEQKELRRTFEDSKKMIDQNKELLDSLKKKSEETNESVKGSIEKKVDEIEKNLFRLVIILGSAGVGTIITVIQTFLRK